MSETGPEASGINMVRVHFSGVFMMVMTDTVREAVGLT